MTHTILTFIFTEIHVHACPQTCALCRNILLNRMDTQHACVLYRRPVICAGADGRRSEYSTSHFQNVLNFRFNLRDYTDAICDSLVLFFFCCLYARGFIVHLSKTAAYWWEHCRPFSASILVAGLYHSRTARPLCKFSFLSPICFLSFAGRCAWKKGRAPLMLRCCAPCIIGLVLMLLTVGVRRRRALTRTRARMHRTTQAVSVGTCMLARSVSSGMLIALHAFE